MFQFTESNNYAKTQFSFLIVSALMTKLANQLPPALKHGAYSGAGLLPGEDAAAFKKLHDDLSAEFVPVGPLEEDIVETMARLVWRKQNLQTYRLAGMAEKRASAIRWKIVPQRDTFMFDPDPPDTRDPEQVRAAVRLADEQAEKELGPLLELVEMRDDITFNRLYEEWSVIDRLDGMIDRCIKRLLMVRGFKSMSASVSEASSSPRKRLTTN